MLDFKVIYNQWCRSSVLTADQKQQLIDINDDENEQKERFAASLEFGTAGMRGVIGMGTNRMNEYTVVRATRGLAAYIRGLGVDAIRRGVVISYDTRRYSAEFAIYCAEVLNENGIRAYLFEDVRPVPMCSFAIRELDAVAGIMITASHNPKQYNGYKVYGEDGAQMSPVDTAVVVGFIDEITDYFNMPKRIGITAKSIKGLDNYAFENVKIIGRSLDEKYFAAISRLRLSPDAVRAARDIKIVYTPLHGSGYMPVTTILARMGVPVNVVESQAAPDPDFSTVKVPNPEESSALKLAVELAEEIGSNVVIGTDPDCDRMGIAVRDNSGRFILLNGNQIGVLLMDYILRLHSENGTLPKNSAVVKTIVTTQLANRVAESYGATVFDVLTGFKFIGEKIKEWEASGKYTFMFGFEESYGSLSGTHARDKDAVVASMLFAEMACYYEGKGSSVFARLMEIFEKFGYYTETAFSFSFSGLDGMSRMRAIMERIRRLELKLLAGTRVKFISDYASGITVNDDGSAEQIKLPKTNAVYFGLENGDWLCVRPSGTEPKLKMYIAASAPTKEEADTRNAQYKAAAEQLFGL